MQKEFYRRVGIVCRRIPRGRVATYGQIALLCGKPRNSRQVGYGLKMGLAGEDVPAHRVVNSQGILSGEEVDGTSKVLKAAALTYVAAAAASILQLLRLVILFGHRREE